MSVVVLGRAVDNLEVIAVKVDHGIEAGRVAVVASGGAVAVLGGGAHPGDGVLGQGQVVVGVAVVVGGGDGAVLGGLDQLVQLGHWVFCFFRAISWKRIKSNYLFQLFTILIARKKQRNITANILIRIKDLIPIPVQPIFSMIS